MNHQRRQQYISKLLQINIENIINNLDSQQLRILIQNARQQSLSEDEEIVIHKIIDIQLNEVINNITQIELQFLKSKNFALTTYSRYVSEYRQAIKQLFPREYIELDKQYRSRYQKCKNIINSRFLKIEKLEEALSNIKNDTILKRLRGEMDAIKQKNITAHIAQIALYKMTIGKELHAQLNHNYKQTKQKRQEEYQCINSKSYIKIATELLNATSYLDYHKLILGLCALTGRRQIEVVKTGKFALYDEDNMLFSGQAKKRQTDTNEYVIPVLCEPALIMEAHKNLRMSMTLAKFDYRNLTNVEINNRLFTTHQTAHLKRDIFQAAHPENFSDKSLSLRSAYAAICYKVFKPNMSFRAYAAKILNHANMDSADAYDQYNTV